MCVCTNRYSGSRCEIAPGAALLDVNGEGTHTAIDAGGEKVRFEFDAEEGTTYELLTTLAGLPDTVMTLYDVDGTTELLENDDTDVGRESYLMWTCPASGRYGVRVRAYDDTQTGGTAPHAPVVESHQPSLSGCFVLRVRHDGANARGSGPVL